MTRKLRRRLGAAALVAAIAALPMSAAAGEINVSWNPSATATGYKVHIGAAPGSYDTVIDVGNVTQTTVTTLPDCSASYFAVSAYNSAGESGLSSEVSSWPRPELTSATPASATAGSASSVTLAGANFQGGASVAFGHPDVSVQSVAVGSCSQIVVDVAVASSAAAGPSAISVAHANGVTGSAAGLFAVTPVPLGTVMNPRRTDVQQP